MKKFLIYLVLFVASLSLRAQLTNVTATITDSDSTVWSKATWQVSFVPAPGFPNLSSYTINGVAIQSNTYINRELVMVREF